MPGKAPQIETPYTAQVRGGRNGRPSLYPLKNLVRAIKHAAASTPTTRWYAQAVEKLAAAQQQNNQLRLATVVADRMYTWQLKNPKATPAERGQQLDNVTEVVSQEFAEQPEKIEQLALGSYFNLQRRGVTAIEQAWATGGPSDRDPAPGGWNTRNQLVEGVGSGTMAIPSAAVIIPAIAVDSLREEHDPYQAANNFLTAQAEHIVAQTAALADIQVQQLAQRSPNYAQEHNINPGDLRVIGERAVESSNNATDTSAEVFRQVGKNQQLLNPHIVSGIAADVSGGASRVVAAAGLAQTPRVSGVMRGALDAIDAWRRLNDGDPLAQEAAASMFTAATSNNALTTVRDAAVYRQYYQESMAKLTKDAPRLGQWFRHPLNSAKQLGQWARHPRNAAAQLGRGLTAVGRATARAIPLVALTELALQAAGPAITEVVVGNISPSVAADERAMRAYEAGIRAFNRMPNEQVDHISQLLSTGDEKDRATALQLLDRQQFSGWRRANPVALTDHIFDHGHGMSVKGIPGLGAFSVKEMDVYDDKEVQDAGGNETTRGAMRMQALEEAFVSVRNSRDYQRGRQMASELQAGGRLSTPEAELLATQLLINQRDGGGQVDRRTLLAATMAADRAAYETGVTFSRDQRARAAVLAATYGRRSMRVDSDNQPVLHVDINPGVLFSALEDGGQGLYRPELLNDESREVLARHLGVQPEVVADHLHQSFALDSDERLAASEEHNRWRQEQRDQAEADRWMSQREEHQAIEDRGVQHQQTMAGHQRENVAQDRQLALRQTQHEYRRQDMKSQSRELAERRKASHEQTNQALADNRQQTQAADQQRLADNQRTNKMLTDYGASLKLPTTNVPQLPTPDFTQQPGEQIASK